MHRHRGARRIAGAACLESGVCRAQAPEDGAAFRWHGYHSASLSCYGVASGCRQISSQRQRACGLRRLLRHLRRRLETEGQDWDVWTRWYAAVLDGNTTPGGEDLAIYRVTLDSEEDWRQGPAHANALIRKREEEIVGRGAESAASGSIGAAYSFDFGGQNTIAISFGVTADGKVDVRPGVGADRVSTSRDSVDSHAEVKRFSEELIAKHESGQKDPNNGNAIACAETRLLQEALGHSIEEIRPGLLIPRGEALRKTIERQKNRDDMSDVAPLSDGMLDQLDKLVGAYNAFILMDEELARRDQAVVGPDAKRNLVIPEEAIEVAEDAASRDAATPQAAAAVAEEAANAPANPNPDNRNSRRLSETAKNFGRTMLGRVQSFVRWIGNNPNKSFAVPAAPFFAAQWALANEAWLLRYFADNPAMLSAVKSIVDFLKTLPLAL